MHRLPQWLRIGHSTLRPSIFDRSDFSFFPIELLPFHRQQRSLLWLLGTIYTAKMPSSTPENTRILRFNTLLAQNYSIPPEKCRRMMLHQTCMEHVMTRLAITGMDARDSAKGASRETPKEALVRDWVRRKLGRIDHELRVARLARHLFELTHRWHGLGHAERRLLVLGSLVHDVGRAIEDKGHARHGARMILDSTGLPVNETAGAPPPRLPYPRHPRPRLERAGRKKSSSTTNQISPKTSPTCACSWASYAPLTPSTAALLKLRVSSSPCAIANFPSAATSLATPKPPLNSSAAPKNSACWKRH